MLAVDHKIKTSSSCETLNLTLTFRSEVVVNMLDKNEAHAL